MASSLTDRLRRLRGRDLVLVWILSNIIVYGLWFGIAHGAQGDVWYYWRQLQIMRYLGPQNTLSEYPLPCVLLLSIPQWLSFGYATVYTYCFIGLMLALHAGFTWTLWRLSRHDATGHRDARPALYWTIFVALLGSIGMQRFDIVPAVLAGWAVLCLRPRGRGYAVLAGVLIALGASIKLWPALLILALLGRKDKRWPVLAGFVGMGLVTVGLCLWYAGWDRLVSPLGWQKDRGLQIESVWATVPMVQRALGAPFEVFVSPYQAFEIYGAPKLWLTLAGYATTVGGAIILVLAGWFLFSRARRDLGVAAMLMVFITGVMIITNKTFSPQYVMWLGGPLAALLTLPHSQTVLRGSPIVRRCIVGSLVLSALTQLIYPVGYPNLTLHTALTGLLTAVLAVRNLGMIALVVAAGAAVVRAIRARRARSLD